MKTAGIRISDSRDNVLDVRLADILEEIQNGSLMSWCILFLDGMPNPGEGKSLADLQNKINKSENGLHVTWNDIRFIEKKFFQIYETVISGCGDDKFLHRYKDDQLMYQSCDIVIDLVDCAFWEVYSKDPKLIDRLKSKFQETEDV